MKQKIFFIFLSITSLLQQYVTCRIPLYVIFTPSHKILFEKYFQPSLQDNFDLHIKKIPQECPSAEFMSENWTKTTIKKVIYIIEAIKENRGNIIIYADVDIQFFGPIEKDIRRLMKKKDFLIQKDDPKGRVCSGFFVMRANKKTLALWEDVLTIMQNDHTVSDQTALNRCLNKKKNPYAICWDYLPNRYFGGGTLTGRSWRPGRKIYVPKNAKMHHANWTKGIKNKIKQLLYVKKIFTCYRTIKKKYCFVS